MLVTLITGPNLDLTVAGWRTAPADLANGNPMLAVGRELQTEVGRILNVPIAG
jgi:hypothetical protein